VHVGRAAAGGEVEELVDEEAGVGHGWHSIGRRSPRRPLQVRR
jgi:hypothetical protein